MSSIFTSWGKKIFGKTGKSIDKSLFGSKDKFKAVPTLDKNQMSLFRHLLKNIDPSQLNIMENPSYQQGASYLDRLLSNDPELYQQFEAPYMRQFQEEILPEIATRFAGRQQSSAFQQALGQQASGLSERLAALRGGMQMQALPEALRYGMAPSAGTMGAISQGLGTPTFGYLNKKGQPGFLPQLGGAAAQGLGMALPYMMMM